MRSIRGIFGLSAVMFLTVGLGAMQKTAAPVQKCSGEPQQISLADSGYPQVILDNGQLKVVVYTPDEKKAYYRGSRFDWSGVVGKVEYKGHAFYADWKTPHDPVNPEHGIGPVEEFDIDGPSTYAQAKVGGTFIKIGIGALVRPEKPEKYFFNMPYEVKRIGSRELTATKRCVEFVQSISDSAGYGYHYTKSITLDGATMTIFRRLKNNGSQPIETEHYCHNFTSIDGDPVGPSYRMRLPFAATIPEDAMKKFQGIAAIKDRVMTFTAELTESGYLFASFGGLKNEAGENGFFVENMRTGASVAVTGNLAPSKFNFFAVRSTLCPEPFVRLSIKPGETMEWKTDYRFAVEKKADAAGEAIPKAKGK